MKVCIVSREKHHAKEFCYKASSAPPCFVPLALQSHVHELFIIDVAKHEKVFGIALALSAACDNAQAMDLSFVCTSKSPLEKSTFADRPKRQHDRVKTADLRSVAHVSDQCYARQEEPDRFVGPASLCTSLRKLNGSYRYYSLSGVIATVALSYGSVPMYKMVCQQTGWGGIALRTNFYTLRSLNVSRSTSKVSLPRQYRS